MLYDHGALIAVNKPPGLPVHCAPGPGSSVLRQLRAQGLSGLVPAHRLDKDASGVLVLCRSPKAAAQLQALWTEAEKTYLALCAGIPAQSSGVIAALLLENQTGKPERLASALRYYRSQHPDVVLSPPPRPKTTAVHPAGRPAETEYEVLEAFNRAGSSWSWLRVRPRQGRMHQIRVHLAFAGYALAVDPLYGARAALAEQNIGGGSGAVLLSRLSLHADTLVFPDPQQTGARITIQAPLPEDLSRVLAVLRGGRV